MLSNWYRTLMNIGSRNNASVLPVSSPSVEGKASPTLKESLELFQTCEVEFEDKFGKRLVFVNPSRETSVYFRKCYMVLETFLDAHPKLEASAGYRSDNKRAIATVHVEKFQNLSLDAEDMTVFEKAISRREAFFSKMQQMVPEFNYKSNARLRMQA